jgi:hypothetical protein
MHHATKGPQQQEYGRHLAMKQQPQPQQQPQQQDPEPHQKKLFN